MKKAHINISHFRFVLCYLKIFGEIATTLSFWVKKELWAYDTVVDIK